MGNCRSCYGNCFYCKCCLHNTCCFVLCESPLGCGGCQGVRRRELYRRYPRVDDWKQCLNDLDTGDVLLFSCNHAFGRLTQCLAHKYWDHVALVVRQHGERVGPDHESNPLPPTGVEGVAYASEHVGQLQLLEATGEGTYAYPLVERLATRGWQDSYVLVLKLRGRTAGDAARVVLENFYAAARATAYEKDLCQLAKAIWYNPDPAALADKSKSDLSSIFCSELISEALQQMGLMNFAAANSNEFLPHHWLQPGDSTATRLRGCVGGYHDDSERQESDLDPEPSLVNRFMLGGAYFARGRLLRFPGGGFEEHLQSHPLYRRLHGRTVLTRGGREDLLRMRERAILARAAERPLVCVQAEMRRGAASESAAVDIVDNVPEGGAPEGGAPKPRAASSRPVAAAEAEPMSESEGGERPLSAMKQLRSRTQNLINRIEDAMEREPEMTSDLHIWAMKHRALTVERAASLSESEATVAAEATASGKHLGSGPPQLESKTSL